LFIAMYNVFHVDETLGGQKPTVFFNRKSMS